MELLAESDPSPVGIINPDGRSSFLIIGDHAGVAIPQRLGKLGLGDGDLGRHIACDIGIFGLGAALSARLDAVFIHQRYSRLVIDCNRDPSSSEAIVEASDGTPIPGNRALDGRSALARVISIHRPYHQGIAAELARRREARQPTILVSLHSFTRTFRGYKRPWDIGVLYDGGETSLAEALLRNLSQELDLIVGDNQPYKMDATDFTVPYHAYPWKTAYVELEIAQDLITSQAGQQRWEVILVKHLNQCVDRSLIFQ
jgi:predicted N-formylglutamate amidohydrolase